MWEWLKVADTAVRAADKKILTTMEASGYFSWHEEITRNVLSKASALEYPAMVSENASAGAPPRGEVDRLVAEISDTLQQGSVSVDGRRATMEQAARVLKETGLAVVARLHQKCSAEYDACKGLQEMKERLVAALRKVPATS